MLLMGDRRAPDTGDGPRLPAHWSAQRGDGEGDLSDLERMELALVLSTTTVTAKNTWQMC